MQWIKKHKVWSSVILLGIISIIWMYMTDTLSYPYILVDRQIEMIKYCSFGSNEFQAKAYGFDVTAPKEYCLLPNRLFPEDGTVQVVPKGNYFVINEYAKGTVTTSTRATLLFEPLIPTRNTKDVMATLSAGRFLNDVQESDMVNKNGVKIHIAKNVSGIEEGSHYDWAFIEHPDGKVFLSILLSKIDEPETFNYILENIKPI